MNTKLFLSSVPWISSLGSTKAKTYWLFNFIAIFYGIFNLGFIGKLSVSCPQNLALGTMMVLYGFHSLLIFLLVLFPVSKNFKAHRGISDLLFTNILLALVVSLLCLRSPLLLLTILVGVSFLISFVTLKLKYHHIPRDLEEIREKEKSVFVKSASLMEWIFFSMLILFQLSVVIV